MPSDGAAARQAGAVHSLNRNLDEVARQIVEYSLERIRMSPPPLDHPRPAAELTAEVGASVTPAGIGGEEALRRFTEVLAPAVISVDHPRFLSFVASAPTEAAALFDLVVGASSMYGPTWLEAAGAVHAENEALRWIADLAGLPETAGGCFASGGTSGNLSALVAARHAAAAERERPHRWAVIAGDGAHSSIDHAARVMDIDVVTVPTDERGRLTGPALAERLTEVDGSRLFAVVATAGTTNLGIVDDLAGVADVAAEHDLWLHVDGAYGGAALAAPSVRDRFTGIERADSFIVDPHKWLFAPYDSCALLYRRPELAQAAHTQSAGYLDVIHDRQEWDPSDYAVHLSRRARGLPFWFSLATYGTEAYAEAVETVLATAHAGADLIRDRDGFELVVEPELSVVVFRRHGWAAEDYRAWSDAALHNGLAFAVPTTHDGETIMRWCLVNPTTTVGDLEAISTTWPPSNQPADVKAGLEGPWAFRGVSGNRAFRDRRPKGTPIRNAKELIGQPEAAR